MPCLYYIKRWWYKLTRKRKIFEFRWRMMWYSFSPIYAYNTQETLLFFMKILCCDILFVKERRWNDKLLLLDCLMWLNWYTCLWITKHPTKVNFVWGKYKLYTLLIKYDDEMNRERWRKNCSSFRCNK